MADSKNGRRECRPWFQMYPTDYFGSPKVARMNAEERGVYTTIMFRSWTDDGYVLDMEDLADELDITVERLAEIMAGRVGRALFEDEDGRLRSTRLEEERSRAMTKAEIAAANGKKGGRPRKKPSVTQRVSNGTQPLANETQPQPSETQLGPSITQPELSCAELSCASTSPSTETNSLPSGASGARERQPRPDEPVPQPKLDRALRESLEPVPPEAVRALREWAEHVGERVGVSKGVAHWRKLVTLARKGPPVFADRVGFSIHVDAKSVLSPSPKELAEWRGEHEDGKGREQFVSSRVATQRANDAAGKSFAASVAERQAQSAAALDAHPELSQLPWVAQRPAGGELAALEAPRDVSVEGVA